MKSAIKHRKRVHDMKKNRPGSITLRITLWSALILIALELLTFLMFRFVSGSILEKTVRGYLLSSVNENTDKIKFYNADNAEGSEDTDNMRIRYRSGWLEIDDDFLDEINDVQSALYTSDGSMPRVRLPGRWRMKPLFPRAFTNTSPLRTATGMFTTVSFPDKGWEICGSAAW